MKRIILALDVNDSDHALTIVERFSNEIDIFKVGLELYTVAGPDIVRAIHERGKKVFLDLKFHDIPTTVSKAALAATRLGVYMFNMHVSSGPEALLTTTRAVTELCLKENLDRPKMLGVTVLTSISNEVLREEFCVHHNLRTHVKHLARLAKKCGLDGVVASGQEATMIKEQCGSDFLIVTPGIRASWAAPDDQMRTMTPKEAIRHGADFLVIGRSILRQPEPEKALELINLEILTSL